MSAEAGFLSAIIEAPEDDAPRLIYADWLEDHDNAARAELIRTQIALARLDVEAPEAAALRAREAALLEEHRTEWLGDLAELGDEHGFRRGMVERVTFPLAQFLSVGPELFRRAPITELCITKAGGDLMRVAAMPQLGRLRRLELKGGSPSLARLEALFRTRRLANLRELDLGELGGRASAARALLGAPLLRQLTELNLSNGRVSPALLGDLLSRTTGGLRKLFLRHNPLSDEGASVVADSPHLAALEELDLAYTHLTAVAGTALAESLHLRRLRKLNLHFNALNGPGGAALAASPILDHVFDLNIGFNEITDAGAIPLFRSRHATRVRVLNLNHSEMTDQAILVLAGSPLLGQLRELYLGYNEMGHDGVMALAQAPGLAGVRRMNLCSNHIGRAGTQALAASPYAAALEFLDIESNRITNDGARALARSPHLAALRELLVAERDMGQVGRAALRRRFGDGLTVY